MNTYPLALGLMAVQGCMGAFDTVYHHELTEALAQRGDLDGAISEYRKLLAMKPDYAHAHNNLGEALAGKGDLDAAIEEYRKALAINPSLAEASKNLEAALALKRGR